MLENNNHLILLRQIPLFSALDEGQLEQLSTHITRRKFSRGEHVFAQGDEARAFYLLLNGQVRLYRLSPSGQEKVVELVNPGQTFAEALMFQEVPRYPVHAQVLADSELLCIASSGFVTLLSSSVESCFKVMGSLSIRLRRLLGEIDALTLQNAGLRVSNYLLQLLPDGEEVLILPAAKQVIASRLSIQPETFSRTLHSLAAQGVIEVNGQQIRVLDVAGLRRHSA
ncbi:MAG: Crp/Fnr family transcriptional regulator [Chromatiales bacterium]|nr:Crp/Fnr family transcriptional regulator [Chromatiales bacterium]